jgi:hypothetical protein
MLSGETFRYDRNVNSNVCRTVGAHISSSIDAATDTASNLGASICAARTADRSVHLASASASASRTEPPSPIAEAAGVIDCVAVVAAGAANVGVAVEPKRIGGLETAHDAHASQDCARESERKTSPERMHGFH